MLWQTRDEEILRILAIKVRLLSLTQIAETWWTESPSGIANARRRLHHVETTGLVRSIHVQARPLPEFDRAVVTWRPTEPEPDHEAASWQLQKRWKDAPRRTTAYIATRKGANQFGGRATGTLRYDFQATHDLGVAAVYLRMAADNPQAARTWVGEDLLARFRRREKLPDAVLADSPSDRPKLVVEFGGAYDAGRLRAFHDDCASRKLPYQIW